MTKQLCAVRRQHYDRIGVLDLAVSYSVKIGRASQNVIVPVTLTRLTLPKKILSLAAPIMHLLGHWRTLPARLELWTKGECGKRLLGNLSLSIGLLEPYRIVTRLVTPGTLFEVCEGPSKGGTRVDAHVVLPSNDAGELGNHVLNPPVR